MQVTIVHVRVKTECIADFVEACRLNHEGSLGEPGNHGFDVLQEAGDPSRLVLYEVFDDPDAVARHKETEHYLRWRDTVAGMMAEPRRGVPYRRLFPAE